MPCTLRFRRRMLDTACRSSNPETDSIRSGFAAGCELRLADRANPETDSIRSGFAAGCELRLADRANPETDFIGSGFAAGCEARLCLAVHL